MNLTSFSFFIMIACTVCLYFILPLKIRYIAILLANGYFIAQSNSVFAIICMVCMALLTYISSLLLEKYKEENPKRSKLIMSLSIIAIALFLIILKDANFFINTGNILIRLFHGSTQFSQIHISAPLGISYFALSYIGYLLDIYWGIASAEKNILKFGVFSGYFPLLTSGPIVRLKDYREKITEGHPFDYKKFCFGLQRVLWGLLKKLVISSRLAVYVDAIYNNHGYDQFVGTYVLLAMFLFVFQLYTDFSGCIDIIMGVSEMLGIELPENFDLPFISKNLSEFWRRWHITLGAFLRDYILYSILKSSPFQKLGKISKKKFGKKFGKQIPVWCGMLISWFLIGFWHGGYWNYIIGVGLFFGCMIILGEMCKPLTEKLISVLKINVESFGFKVFQSLRTFILFAFGLSFFRSYGGFKEALFIWRSALFEFSPWIFFDQSLLNFGLDAKDWQIIVFYMMILAITGIIKAIKKQSIRELIASEPLVFRWILYIALFISVILFGCYGPGYDAQSFIYQNF